MIDLLAKTKNTIINTVFNKDLTLSYGFNSGGYENYQFFITADGGVLSLETVKDELKNDPSLFDDENDPQWYIVASEVNYENDNLYCDHSNKLISAAYED